MKNTSTPFEWYYKQFVQTRVWKIFEKGGPFNFADYDKVQGFILVKVLGAYEDVIAKYPYLARKARLQDLHRVRQAENINLIVDTLAKLDNGTKGSYLPSIPEFGGSTILIDNKLSNFEFRLCYAHELGHHFLHGDRLQTMSFTPWKGWIPGTDVNWEGMKAEIEADMFASMLLAGGVQ